MFGFIIDEFKSFCCDKAFNEVLGYIATTSVFLFINKYCNTLAFFKALSIVLLILVLIVVHFLINAHKDLKRFKPNAISFADLCFKINSLLIKNNDLFREFAPNGNQTDTEMKLKDDNDLLLWEEIKKNDIKNNNQTILNLIQANEDLIYEKNKAIFNKMINHIKAFDLHIENELFDYSQYQFPKEFAEFIKTECKSINLVKIKKIEKWIKNETKRIPISKMFLLGSLLNDYFNNIKDIDVLILLSEKASKEIASQFITLKNKFYNKFKKELHLTVFSINEKAQYEDFKNKLNNTKGF